MWSRRHQCCLKCGTTNRKHLARGLCERCYRSPNDQNRRPKNTVRGTASLILTKSFLHTEYIINKRSLAEIAASASCSRPYVYKRLKEYGITLRSKRAARILALKKGKISFDRTTHNGEKQSIILHPTKVNDKFFKPWSPPMAYVLGVIYTDGSLRRPRFSVSQKEPELLNKILKLMSCNAKLLFSKGRTYDSGGVGPVYYFHIHNNNVYNDLKRIGLTPRKSSTITFPDVPPIYVRHFIRGCWDGDGSVFIKKGSNHVGANFVSGSLEFIEGMLVHLYWEGFKKRTISKSRNSFSFSLSGEQCSKLYHYLYDGVSEEEYLMRKYLIFKSTEWQDMRSRGF